MSNTKTLKIPVAYDHDGTGHFTVSKGEYSSLASLASYVRVEYDTETLAAFFESLLDAQRSFSPTSLLTAEADGIFTVTAYVDTKGNEADLGALFASLFELRSDGWLTCRFEGEDKDFVHVFYLMHELQHSPDPTETSQPGSTV